MERFVHAPDVGRLDRSSLYQYLLANAPRLAAKIPDGRARLSGSTCVVFQLSLLHRERYRLYRCGGARLVARAVWTGCIQRANDGILRLCNPQRIDVAHSVLAERVAAAMCALARRGWRAGCLPRISRVHPGHLGAAPGESNRRCRDCRMGLFSTGTKAFRPN